MLAHIYVPTGSGGTVVALARSYEGTLWRKYKVVSAPAESNKAY